MSIQFTEEIAGDLNDLFPNGRLSAVLPEAAGQLFMNIAEGNELPPDDESETADEPQDSASFYLEARSHVDYEGVASVSKNQKIEILSAAGHETVYSITDLHEIVEFLNRQNTSDWTCSSIPDDAERICDIIRYVQRRHTRTEELEEQYRDVLYEAQGSYYIQTLIPDNGTDSLWVTPESLCFKIPDETGEFLHRLCR